MNKHLQHLLQIIQRDKSLTEEEKHAAIKSLKDADKELEVTAFKLDRTEKVKHTTAVLLEETIAELEQKRKAVEVQNRELEIEAALERVRARTMGLQKSEDLREVVKILYAQLIELGFKWGAAAIIIMDSVTGDIDWWMEGFDDGYDLPEKYHVPYFDHRGHREQLDQWKNGAAYAVIEITGQEKKSYDNYYFYQTDFVRAPESTKQLMMQQEAVLFSMAYMQYGALSWSPSPLTEDQAKILQRFAKVFEQTYTRFLDLQKAEAQAREAQIEAALERVRSRSLAMHHSEELEHVVASLFDRLTELGISFDGASIFLFEQEKRSIQLWVASKISAPLKVIMPYDKDIKANPITNDLWNAIDTGEDIINKAYSGKVKDDYYHYVFRYNESLIPEWIMKMMLEAESWTVTLAAEKNSAVCIDSWYGTITTEENYQVIKRFARVFQQAYTRFLDLQKAEAQAREAQIQLALERVRARTMAMQRSDELAEAAQLLYQQFHSLGIKTYTCAYMFIEEEQNLQRGWTVSSDGTLLPDFFDFPLTGDPILDQRFQSWKNKQPIHEAELKSEANKKHHTFLVSMQPREFAQHIVAHLPDQVFFYNANFRYGYLFIVNTEPLSAEEKEIAIRFANVFEQTYTRFLDLKKAEAQAREAQIEAALERVRSRTMGMQKSEDLREVVNVLYAQLKELGFQQGIAAINIMDPDTGDIDSWGEGFEDGYDLPEKYHVPSFDHPGHHEIIRQWKSGTLYAVVEITGQDKKSLDNYYFYQTDFVRVPEATKQFMMQQESVRWSMAYMQYGAIMWSPSPISDEQSKILQRFAKVFEQTYTRFLDLQKAEAQTREAQIEAALERVRSKAMTMQTSDDLNALIGHIFTECTKLGLTLDRCLVQIVDPHTLDTVWILANPELPDHPSSYLVKYHEHPPYLKYLEAWKNKTERWQYVLGGKEKRDWDDFIFKETGLAQLPEPAKNVMRSLEKILLNSSFGNFGNLTFSSFEPLTEHQFDLLIRFAKVLELTYTRFNDLKQAEARAKEAVKQAALDRVRADIASMRNTADLDRITPLIWKELTTLGITFIRCGVFIMDDKENKVHTYLSTPEGRAIAAYHTPMNDSGSLAGAIEHWRQQKVFVTRWVDSDFQLQAEVLLKQGSITSREQYLNTLPKGGFYLHFLPFSQGMLYVGSHESLPSEVLQLVQSLADAFSVAYARYEDFTKLESAKAQIEKTLTDLKQTQTQLIQSEKMASLGELTAGIAHEIQNPLNFVNNFSEVSKELVDEMNEELKVGNQQLAVGNVPLATSHWKTAVDISNDLKQNLEKINHHGKRADGIVKSMLQHSRKSNNQKELTDINALCDEYLRLSYHGLRAKDKSFNAKFEIQCDPELPKLNVLPQDVGRVILNLINNAFYAVSERQKVESETLTESGKPKAESLKSSVDKYEPKVTVTTKYLGDKVEIRVKDNGTGIPAKVKEKIFQPFFTTKPTGQGTGLGLSLSYDIITKGHGGEIKMETKEGKGSEFTIVLPV